ncbi:Beta-hexosaminidase [Lunatimonas lonarensis]|uniref:beta-N-acetylhexosaminidase n=1 Tax=Lunatimonas lonarensis TaxID=1232681 RepID=R7ZUN4_9BACT|nr:family 20 glycosylhydrolase [Lunatimonas lonarensis]EON77865.1 Beta-hexosaminidase [Lunatimonas lonarensis]
MHKFHSLFLLLLVLVISYACGGNPSWEEDLQDIRIEWELVSNFLDESGQFEAKFVFHNEGTRDLGSTGWKLFFNMSPRMILPYADEGIAKITHINGDWYEISPGREFTLPAGGSVSFTYRGVEGVIKESDAPMGLYFVFYDKDGDETEVLLFDNLTVVSFERTEQLLRGDMDRELPSSPERRYAENESLSVVDEGLLHPIVPTPFLLSKRNGVFSLSTETPIFFDAGLESEAKYLRSKLAELTGVTLEIRHGNGSGGHIQIGLGNISVDGRREEAYELDISAGQVKIVGSDPAGAFYGIQSLLAWLGPEVFLGAKLPLDVGLVHIEDAPRFHFRSLHMDVSRNFQTKETVMRMLDLMAHYKLNHFLFYTTEDEGWRLEIDGLPELTEVGAQRQHVSSKDDPALHPAYGSGPFAYSEGKHGSGYYSKADFIEILKYAKERHITIIPELNFPGHARAAIKSMEARYHKYMAQGDEAAANEYRLIDPEDRSVYLSAQAFKDNTVSVARESTYRFYEKVMDEIARMYDQAGLKLTKIHAGGDEVPEGAWTQSPLAAELLNQLPDIDDPKNLQGYFFRELLKRLEKLDVEVHVWEEMALKKMPDGNYVPNPEFVGKRVIPYIWNNMFDYPDMGYQLANAGYEVVLCNVSNFYFDLAYSNDPKEPGLYWAGFVNTRNAWTFAPFDWFKTTMQTSFGEKLDMEKASQGMVKIKSEARKNIIGVEAQLWSETIKGRDMIEYYTVPKIIGYAESAWAKERTWETIETVGVRNASIASGWNVFANTIARREYPKLAAWNKGYNYRIAPPGAKLENGMLFANVEFPGLDIRYTTNGTDPTVDSPRYDGPIALANEVRLKAFDKSGKSSPLVIMVADEVSLNPPK